jgi:hippurate hydrolase
MIKIFSILLVASFFSLNGFAQVQVDKQIQEDYQSHLKPLFVYFHQHPELSMAESNTAARIAKELKSLGFEVHEKIGKTGVVALLKNGEGPLVMMRADMDGLPLKEDSGLDYASSVTQIDPIKGELRPVMHACGHDVHITSLVGSARYMKNNMTKWSGTLMLVAQPAEERIMGARLMMEDDFYQTLGKPDFALGLHVGAEFQTGKLNVISGPLTASSNSVDILIHGIGAHGASPHEGKDPIVLGSQIVMALQTLVSRELGPKEPGVVTVGAFNSGFKHNIISDQAHLQITVRSATIETRDKLLNGIERIAVNIGRAAGMPENLLPEITISKQEFAPPQVNDPALTNKLRKIWQTTLTGVEIVSEQDAGMGAEDFPFFVTDDKIPSFYWVVGGTPKADIDAAKAGGPPVPSHHSPFFKIDPDNSVPLAVESTVSALIALMPAK